MTYIFTPFNQIDGTNITFALGPERHGKPQIQMYIAADAIPAREVAFITPACVTNWPRCNGDGNFGTMWGPTDLSKAKFTLDLTDAHLNCMPNTDFGVFAELLTLIDDRLLDFVQSNQLKILGRKNLSRDEVKMLQIRSVRPKYDKVTGAIVGHSLQCSASKFTWDGMGGKMARSINVCDKDGQVVLGGVVQPGDIVASTVYANQVYTGVGGDKFGIHWSFQDVQVLCQRAFVAPPTVVNAFQGGPTYDFARPFLMEDEQQFSDPTS